MWGREPLEDFEDCMPPSWMKTMLLIAIWLASVVLACSFLSETCAAAELTQGQVNAAYAVAYGHMGHIPQNPPTIRIVSRERMCEVAEQPGCRMPGIERAGVVYLIDTIDPSDPFQSSVLVHELVHYVQYDLHGEATTCEERVRREREAYEIQALALEMAGYSARRLSAAVSRLRCS